MSLFLTLLAMASEIWAHFQNCRILGHEAWPLAKVAEVANILFLPHGVEVELIVVQQLCVFTPF